MSGSVLNPGVRVVRISGSSRAGPDQIGIGNDTVTFPTAVRFVDVYNGAEADFLAISNGSDTAYVPPGGRLVQFAAAATEFTITSESGAWIVTPHE